MKYASDYYQGLYKFSMSKSNMNRLCWKLEKWDKTFRWKRKYNDFDYKIMMNDNVIILEEDNIVSVGSSIITLDEYLEYERKIEELFLSFCKEMNELAKFQNEVRAYEEENYDWLRTFITKKDSRHFLINWQHYYDTYKNKCKEACPYPEILSNTAVKLCYEKYPNKNKNFLWRISGDSIVQNIKQTDLNLPLKDDNGQYTYLGKKYSLVNIPAEKLMKGVAI